MKRALFAIGLPIISAIGAYYVSNITPYIVIFALIFVFVAVYTGKLKEYYPYYIFGLSLALLWGTSMLGSHIVGNDIHGEYYITNTAIQNGWDIHLRNSNNTSIILAGIAPLLSHIIPVVWQYKLLYPFIFSWTPVLLYFGYRKLFDKRIAILSCLFIVIMPMFVLDMTSHVKGMVAELCLAALLPLVVCDIKLWKRIVGLSLTVIIATISHYSIGALTMIYLIGMIPHPVHLIDVNFIQFMAIIVGIILFLLLMVSKIDIPSYFSFWNSQFWSHNNKLRGEIEEIKMNQELIKGLITTLINANEICKEIEEMNDNKTPDSKDTSSKITGR